MNDEAAKWLAIGVLMAAAALVTLLLRWARSPMPQTGARIGWSMLGGALAGMLLGPTVFGRVLPATYEQWFVGGVTQRLAHQQLVSRQGADLLVASHVGQAEQIEQLNQLHHEEYSRSARLWHEAQWNHQRVLRSFAMVMTALVLLSAGAFVVRQGDRRQGTIAPISIGLWAAALPGALAYACMTAWWGYSPTQGALAAAAAAIGPWILTQVDCEAADQAEFGGTRMIQTAGRIASCLAIAVAMWAIGSQRTITDGLALLALPLAWLIAPLLQGILNGKLTRSATLHQRTLEIVLLPALAACVAIKIDVFEHFAIWPIIVILLLSDDGRWFGAFIGAMLLGGRKALRTARLVMGSMSAGTTQLAVTAIAAQLDALPKKLILPLLLGSLLIDFTLPARRQFARRLVEEEIARQAP